MTRAPVHLVLSCALLATFVAGEAHAEKRVAVILGNNTAGSTREPLRFAVRDARQVASVLGALGGVTSTYVLEDRGPPVLRDTWSKVQAELERERGAATVLFYYSGHADERGLLMGPDRYSFEELRATLRALPAKLHVAVIDACQSGAVARAKGGTAVPVMDLDLRTSGAEHEGAVFITSGANDEAAQESDELEASFFTHYLVSGLRGAADLSGDRRVSLEEAYRFAYVHTLERTRGTLLGPQHPTYALDVEGHGQLVLTWLSADRSYLVLPEAAAGRFVVKSLASAELSAEVKKAAGARLRIAVEPGRYEVLRVDGGEAWAGEVDVPIAREVAVDPGRLVRRPLERFARKGAHERVAIFAGYRVRTGWLVDATPTHGASASVAVPIGDAWLFDAHASYGASRYVRSDRVSVSLDELGLTGALFARFSFAPGVEVLGGVEAGAVWVVQRGAVLWGATETRRSLVAPLGLAAAVDVAVDRALHVRLTGTAGVVVHDGAEGLGAPFTTGFALALGYRP
ncbi:caspase family protein [Myxococcota bacterium]|nr:caspase family protein [Myxococcota bacterium]